MKPERLPKFTASLRNLADALKVPYEKREDELEDSEIEYMLRTAADVIEDLGKKPS